MGPRPGERTELVVDALLRTKVVAVVRTEHPDGLLDAFEALRDGGVVLIEVTMTVPGALDVISAARARLGADVELGAGTVLDAETAIAAAAAGASFVVSPVFDEEVAAACSAADVLAIPGCLTPTEVSRAMAAGVGIVKLFPGRVATPGYLRDLLGPLPSARLLPTGNVDLETAPRYIEAGAVAVGVGKALIDPAAVATGDVAGIRAAARQFRGAVDRGAVNRGARLA